MNVEEYIASGRLELYVTGSLSQEESREVSKAIVSHPELQEEVERIEEALIALAAGVSPNIPSRIWAYVVGSIRGVKQLSNQKSNTNWAARIGWAAAILCIGGIFWMLKQQNDLQKSIRFTTTENTVLKEQNSNTKKELERTSSMLAVLRSKDYETYTLPGNEAVAPEAFAKVYFNAEEKVVYIDTNGLPEAPADKVYQVWSLIMEPLTPRSVGLIEEVSEVEKGMYRFENVPDPEAFGITLEPSGGSISPTLSQLYAIGTVGQ